MYAVEMRGITKQFKNVLANSNVDLLVQRGEIHSLLGENGAGKSTLMNILYGMYAPTSGEISVQGKPVKIENPLKAIELGIAMVHQHFMLIEPMTVAENVVLGYEPKKRGCFDFKKAVSDVEALAKEYGLYVDAREKVENLSVGTKQRVEILKALYRKAEILILDEPTAVLTPQEVTDLFKVLRRLKESGKTILIITHKLKETLALADTVTILRKGQVITSVSTKDVDESKLAELMVGRIVSFQAEKNEVPGEHKVVMALRGATVVKEKRNALDGVSLQSGATARLHLHAENVSGFVGAQLWLELRWMLPEDWTISGGTQQAIFLNQYHCGSGNAEAEFTVTAGLFREPVQTVLLEVRAHDRPGRIYIPVQFVCSAN